jgi:hypothetical protein
MADVSMDYGVVDNMSKVFNTSSEILNAVAKALEIASSILKATAMFGMVGNLALARYLDNIKPKVEALANTSKELSGDLQGAIKALRDGDYSGSQRFV